MLSLAIANRSSIDISHESGAYFKIDDSLKIGEKFYSNKAPGSSVWLALAGRPADIFRKGELDYMDLSFAGRIFALIVPALLFIYMLGRRLEADYGPIPGWLAAGALLLGSNYGSYLFAYYGHSLAALLLGTAFLIAGRRDNLILEGFLLGAAVTVEYNMAPVAGILALRGIWIRSGSPRAHTTVKLAMGAALPMAGMAAYHWQATGLPWLPPFALYETAWASMPNKDNSRLLGFVLPSLGEFANQWFLPARGVFFFSMWALPGVVWGVWQCIRRRCQPDVLWCLLILGTHALVMSGFIEGRVGWSTGMRFHIAVMPFAAILMAAWLGRDRRSAASADTTLCNGAVGARSRPTAAALRCVSAIALFVTATAAHALLATSFPVHMDLNDKFTVNPISTITPMAWQMDRIQTMWPHMLGADNNLCRMLMLGGYAAAAVCLLVVVLIPRVPLALFGIRSTVSKVGYGAATAVLCGILIFLTATVAADRRPSMQETVKYWVKRLDANNEGGPHRNPYIDRAPKKRSSADGTLTLTRRTVARV